MHYCHCRQFFVGLLLPLVIAAQHAKRYTNASTTPSPTCNSCTVTATELFLTYPHPVETSAVNVTVTVTEIPVVTVKQDGSRETNWETVTQTLNKTETFTGTATNEVPPITWVVEGVTLTYPTTYVSMFSFSGGTFTPTTNSLSQPTCAAKVEPLILPENSATGVIAVVTQSIDFKTSISAPAPIIQYLNHIPAVQTQFGSTDLAKCSWTKVVQTRTATEVLGTTAIPVVKVTATALTVVTGAQRVITAPSEKNPTVTAEPAAARIENTDTVLNAPPPANTQQAGTAQANPQQPPAPTATQDIVVSNLIGALGGNTQGNDGTVVAAGATAGSGSNSGSGSGNGGSGSGNGGSGSGNGGSGTAGGRGSQGGSATAGALVPGSGSSGSPSSLVITVGGVATTIAPTVIPGSHGQGSVTAFVVGPGSTVIAGGAPLTLPGTTLSVQASSGAASGKSSASSSGGGVGDAIASGIGYTGPAFTGLGSRLSIDFGVCVLGIVSGAFGLLTVWL